MRSESGVYYAFDPRNPLEGHVGMTKDFHTRSKAHEKSGWTAMQVLSFTFTLESEYWWKCHLRKDGFTLANKIKGLETFYIVCKENGERAAQNGQLASICSKGGKIGGKTAGPLLVKWLTAHPEVRRRNGAIGGKIQGRKNVESGHFARVSAVGRPKGICSRWNIARGKLCTCGLHSGLQG